MVVLATHGSGGINGWYMTERQLIQAIGMIPRIAPIYNPLAGDGTSDDGPAGVHGAEAGVTLEGPALDELERLEAAGLI